MDMAFITVMLPVSGMKPITAMMLITRVMFITGMLLITSKQSISVMFISVTERIPPSVPLERRTILRKIRGRMCKSTRLHFGVHIVRATTALLFLALLGGASGTTHVENSQTTLDEGKSHIVIAAVITAIGTVSAACITACVTVLCTNRNARVNDAGNEQGHNGAHDELVHAGSGVPLENGPVAPATKQCVTEAKLEQGEDKKNDRSTVANMV